MERTTGPAAFPQGKSLNWKASPVGGLSGNKFSALIQFCRLFPKLKMHGGLLSWNPRNGRGMSFTRSSQTVGARDGQPAHGTNRQTKRIKKHADGQTGIKSNSQAVISIISIEFNLRKGWKKQMPRVALIFENRLKDKEKIKISRIYGPTELFFLRVGAEASVPAENVNFARQNSNSVSWAIFEIEEEGKRGKKVNILENVPALKNIWRKAPRTSLSVHPWKERI